MIIAFAALIGVIALVALAGFILLGPAPEIIEGQADATAVRNSSKVPGRIDTLFVTEGQRVEKGDTLGLLSIPDIDAKRAEALAAERAAAAMNEKAIKGARPEEIAAVYQMWQKAKAGLEIAEKSYQRVQNLYDKGVVPAQKRDEALANYNAMIATEKAAREQYLLVKSGAEKEVKEAAAAQQQMAQAAVSGANSYVEESILIAPITGEISEIFLNHDELGGSGAPIMNVLDIDHIWVSFNVREDRLGDLKMNHEFKAIVPALGDREITLKVYYIKDLGTYAAWKATKTTGSYDLKTFEVRGRPIEKVEDLRPGMSVLIKR